MLNIKFHIKEHLSKENCQMLCRDCNLKKSNK
ncbi:HNH endonuclease [Anaerovibrio sp. JC8]